MGILKAILKKVAMAGAVLLGKHVLTEAWDNASANMQEKPKVCVKARAKS